MERVLLDLFKYSIRIRGNNPYNIDINNVDIELNSTWLLWISCLMRSSVYDRWRHKTISHYALFIYSQENLVYHTNNTQFLMMFKIIKSSWTKQNISYFQEFLLYCCNKLCVKAHNNQVFIKLWSFEVNQNSFIFR